MSTVTLQIADFEYDIACGPDQQSHLKQLAAGISKRMREQQRANSGPRSENVSEAYLWLFTALAMQEELRSLHDDLTAAKREFEQRAESLQQDAERAYSRGISQAQQAVAELIEELSAHI